MLDVSSIDVFYGKIQALWGVSLRVDRGQLACLIGSNGAGKSTTLKAIFGLQPPARGSVVFEGQSLEGRQPFENRSLGLALVPEARQVFPFMTVEENLQMGANGTRDRRLIRRHLERIYEQFPRLAERRSQTASTLSGGEQQMLAIGRSLMGSPRLLMLDEPTLGLAPVIIDQIVDILQRLRADGLTILLVEQNADLALDLADVGFVLETGRVVKQASGHELRNDPVVQQAYLGM